MEIIIPETMTPEQMAVWFVRTEAIVGHWTPEMWQAFFQAVETELKQVEAEYEQDGAM